MKNRSNLFRSFRMKVINILFAGFIFFSTLYIAKSLALDSDETTLCFSPKKSISCSKLLVDAAEFKLIKKLADEGNPKSQNQIGWMYDQGLGVKEDPKKAVNWYLKSAIQGFRQAKINIGVMYELGRGVKQDIEISKLWYIEAEVD